MLPERPERGFTLVELMISVTVIVVTAAMLVGHLAVNYRATNDQRDRVFAFSVAKSLITEVHALAAAGETDVDELADATGPVPTLTLIRDAGGAAVPPDHPVSGNIERHGLWIWSREIAVDPLAGLDNRAMRRVTARVFKNDPSGTRILAATLSSVVHVDVQGQPTSQVLDAYLIAIENVPSHWQAGESAQSKAMELIDELEQRNPGLVVRPHLITKLGYGRDRTYRPFLNTANDTVAEIPFVYWYPGLLPTGSPARFLYNPGAISARFTTEAGERNGYDAQRNPFPYALADYYNHATRLPAAREFHARRMAAVEERRAAMEAAREAGDPLPPSLLDMSPEPTLQLLLEDLVSDPDRYRNALLVNLHGEMLPMPPLRNYSDAAKAPLGLPDVRVVAHPEELRTQRPPSTDPTDVRLRVYAYTADPTTYAGPRVMPGDRPILLQVMDLDLTDGSGGLATGVRIENLRGGVPVGGTDRYFPRIPAKRKGDPTLVADEMCYEATFVDPGAGERKFTLLRLFHTPVVCTPVKDPVTGSIRGLAPTPRARLYGLEYVPSCTEPALDFSNDLYASGIGPKNTARWVVTIPGSVFGNRRFVDTASPPSYFDPTTTVTKDRMITFRTRIGDPALADPLVAGTWPNGGETRTIQPHNFSETYTWWAATRDAVPATERWQFDGDPRHNPYKDLWHGDPDFGDGYNWFFDALADSGNSALADFPGIDPSRQTDRWQGRVRQDAPRLLSLLRDGLLRSEVIWSPVNGRLAEFLGTGNEIGYTPAEDFPVGVRCNQRPYGSPLSTAPVDNVRGERRLVRGNGTPYWWGMPWLGELFPDQVAASQWLALDIAGTVVGNLRAGDLVGEFYRDDEESVHAASPRRAYATALHSSNHELGIAGGTTMLNAATSGAVFHQPAVTDVGALAADGSELAASYHTWLPPAPAVDRPFELSASAALGEEWGFTPYTTERCSLDVTATLYDVSNAPIGAAVLELVDPGARRAAWLVASGLEDPWAATDDTVRRYGLLAAIHAYHVAGDPTRSFRLRMLPRVTLEYPTEVSDLANPSEIELLWDVEWRRWDGGAYADRFDPSFFEDDSELDYVVMYARDDDHRWRHVQDDSPARLGVPPDPSLRLPDLTSGAESYAWPTPTFEFPAGRYLLRVEAYRRGQRMHYAFHERAIEITR